MQALDRLNLKRPDTTGFLQRWYGYVYQGETEPEASRTVIWTDIPEPAKVADYTCVVETHGPDTVLVRAALLVYRGEPWTL